MNICLSGFFKKISGRHIFLFPFLVLILLASSCTTSKRTAYFRTLSKDTSIGIITNDFEMKIQKKDILSIVTTSLSPAEDALYNTGTDGIATTPGFVVNDQGKILIHKIGFITAEGLTRRELKEKLQAELLPYLKDPIVSVQFLNHKITVLGDVGTPQVLSMPDEQLSIIDVLVKSGDLHATARRDNIMIIREQGNEKIVKHISLEDHSIFTSPWYWIKPNDIIYVTPDEDLKLKDERRTRIVANVGLITTGLTLLLFIVDRLTR
ncbi:MAG TPA: polysaccharide biosynthesis/export family protein [Ferruginibacter sp.]|nr:polysaccharide biosynthesis/export family protein [Ferruginibacter sp.]